MIRVMLDTDQPQALTGAKVRAPILATYADLMGKSLLAELEAEWGQVVLIDRGQGDPLGAATVIDIERGTHGPADAPGWHDRRHAAGAKHLTVYCDRASVAAVNAAMGTRSYFRWIATLDGTAHASPFTPGVSPAAIQCLGAAQLGFHADLSLVLEDWWNPAPAAAPAPGAAWVKDALGKVTDTENELELLAKLLKAHQ
jgi:hypothetical protein